MSERAVELLGLPEDRACLLLDVGCGSGLSGDYISEEGHYWIGMDISPAMLDVAVEREVEGDLLLADVGHGIPFRPGMFDGCISISAVQWLCNADKKSHSPPKRLYRFFSTLYTALARGSRAVLQLYPENSEQLELITAQAMRAGFTGGMVVDYPNSAKAKKFFLCLFVGTSGTLPKGLGTECASEEPQQAKFTNERYPGGELQVLPAQWGPWRAELHWEPHCCWGRSKGRGRTGLSFAGNHTPTVGGQGQGELTAAQERTALSSQGTWEITCFVPHGSSLELWFLPRAVSEQSASCAFCPALQLMPGCGIGNVYRAHDGSRLLCLSPGIPFFLLVVAWGFLLLALSLPTAVVQGRAPLAALGRDRTKTRGKLSWLPGACGCHVFLPLTLLFSAHSA
uniref:18S rRNA (guanine-N(7))-methyltransferase n=1 Tax=Zonotrichia albicollis TaxID=44394 RepID=A0A8D2MNR6_ZONAL